MFQFGIRRLLVVVTIAAVLCALFVAARNLYYAERQQTNSLLAELTGISDISLHSHVDFAEEINATTFSVDGHSKSIVSLAGLSDFKKTGSFWVSKIGKWRFRVSGRNYGGAYDAETGEPVESQYIGAHIELGTNSPYKDLIPFELASVQDVIDHYQDLIDLFESWPREAKPGTVTLSDGTVQYFYVIEDRQ